MLMGMLPRVKLRSGEREADERPATWLELFYDLVFVVAVAELGHSLSSHYDLVGLLQFVGLFVPVWWTWFHHTVYADRFDSDDVAHHLLTILQMVFVAGLAASVHGATGETSQEFALAIVGIRIVQIVMYLRAWHIKVARPLRRRLIGLFTISSIAWVASTDGTGLVLLAPLAAVSLIPLPSDLLGGESTASDATPA